MPEYKLTYFNVTGFGEPVRYMLSYLGEDFEDKRLAKEEWPAIKPTTPFGKVPVLEVDGKAVAQSTALTRWLGKKAGLAGNDDWESLQIDSVIDSYHDLRQAIAFVAYEKDEEVKATKMVTLKTETIPYYLDKFEEIVKKDGYLANGKMSWADFYFVASSGFITMMTNYDYMDKYENLKKLNHKINSLPQIKKWIQAHSK